MRPFVGAPDRELQVFRPRESNFYESVFNSMKQVMSEKEPPRGRR
jgi:hypothetical protein